MEATVSNSAEPTHCAQNSYRCIALRNTLSAPPVLPGLLIITGTRNLGLRRTPGPNSPSSKRPSASQSFRGRCDGHSVFVRCSAEECLPKLQGLSAQVNAPVQLYNHLTVDCCPVELTLDFTSQNLLHSPILVGVAKELSGEDDVLITICKVPSHDRRILTAADDPPRVELQFEHT